MLIDSKLAALYVDVYCWTCKKLCALANTQEYEGRHYCCKCYNSKIEEVKQNER